MAQAEFLSRNGALSRLCVQGQGGKILQPIVGRQLKGDLCAAMCELMVGHRYSVSEVRDAVDLLTGELSRRSPCQGADPEWPS